MKWLFRLLGFIFVLGSLNSALIAEDIDSSIEVEYYDSGAVFSETNCGEGVEDGFYREYHENGNLSMEIHYLQGQMHGSYRDYCEDGTLRVKFEYKNNHRDGMYKLYYSNGNLESEGLYADGKEQGEHKVYYPNGKLAAIATYKDGKEYGPARTYYKDGTLWEEFNFKNGKLNGEYIQYHENGIIKSVTIYRNGKLKEKQNYDMARKLFLKVLDKNFVQSVLRKEKKVLRHCVSELLGMEFGCNPDWDLHREGRSLTITISEHPRVVMYIEETDHTFRFMSEFNRTFIESTERYAKGFNIQRFDQCDRETVKVSGYLMSNPKGRVSDYYLLDHHQMHKILFTVENEKVWLEYKSLIQDIIDSLNFIRHNDHVLLKEMNADSCEDLIQEKK